MSEKSTGQRSKATIGVAKLAFLFAITLFAAKAGVAQDTLRLTLDQAIATGLENSKSLKQSQARADAARALHKSATTSLLPQISGGASYARLSDVPDFSLTVPFPEPDGSQFTLSSPILDNWSLRVGATQPLFTGGRLKASVDAQRALAESEALNLETDRRNLIFEVEAAYWQLYKAGEFLKVVNETVDLVEAHLKDARSLQQQGLATNSDALAVQVQLADTRLLQIGASDNVRLARIALNNLLGVPLSSQTEIVSAPDTARVQITMSVTELADRAASRRSELKSLELAAEAGKAGVCAANAEWFPQLSAFANYYYANPNQRIQPMRDEFDDAWDAGVSASWSLWNWGGTAYRAQQARADYNRLQHALAEARDGIAAEVTADFLNLNQAREKISVAAEGAQLAQENYRIMRETFRNGLAPNSDLLDAENNLLKARWNSTLSLVDFAVARAKLAKSGATDL